MKAVVFGMMVAIATFGWACSSTRATDAPVEVAKAPAPAAAAALGSPSPNFTLTDHEGKSASLGDYAGKIVVLEWVNPDCPTVQRHAKARTMATLAEKYRDQGVVWLGVNSTSSMGAADNRRWVEASGLAYPVLDDHTGQVAKLYSAKTTPHMFVIDATGKLVYQGGIDDDVDGSKKGGVNYVDRALSEVLAGTAVSMSQTKPYGCSVKYAN
jgi:peroxiredoxin